ncbi:MAG: Tol-Pal system beta propeller repeat protein TolB [Gammaproteobacteria bacterium]|nr:MAG: Tol-Pal system beta propeller repeat protein TolB [Gammaproteobacteria bacterium]
MKKIIQLLTLIAFCLWQSGYAYAIDLSVGQGKVAAKPIAVVPFAGNSGKDKIDFIVSSDLKQSGVFAPISPTTYTDRPGNGEQINYANFRKLGAAYVVFGQVVGQQTLRFTLADTFQQKVLGTFNVAMANKTLRQSAHQISDIILQKLTGTRGAFATRLAYVYESGQGPSRRYRIVISDSDGKNPITLLNSPAPVMTPRFSPNGQYLAYVTYEGNQSQIVIHNIKSGKRRLLSKEKGINSSPAWSPDGSKIAMVLSRDGNSEIYFKNTLNGKLVRVTNNRGIDTEPVWSPDGQFIYFTSDRSGSPQLYRINLSSGGVTRVSSTGRYSAGADISKDGKKIALARNAGGQFIVGTIDLVSGKFNGVSKGFVDETPRFSPNGKMLVFTSTQNGRGVIKIVNVDGSGTNTLSTGGQIRDPDWSNYIR